MHKHQWGQDLQDEIEEIYKIRKTGEYKNVAQAVLEKTCYILPSRDHLVEEVYEVLSKYAIFTAVLL